MHHNTQRFLKIFFLFNLLPIHEKSWSNNEEKEFSHPHFHSERWVYSKKTRQLVMTGPEEGYYEWKNQDNLSYDTLKNEFFECMEQHSFQSISHQTNQKWKEKCQTDQGTIYKRTYDRSAPPSTVSSDLTFLSLNSSEKWLPPSLAAFGKDYTRQIGTFYYPDDKYVYPLPQPFSNPEEAQYFQIANKELFYRCVGKTGTVKTKRQLDGTWKQTCIQEAERHRFKHTRTVSPSSFPSSSYYYDGQKYFYFPAFEQKWRIPSLLDQQTLAMQFNECLQKEGTYTLRRESFQQPFQWKESCYTTKPYGFFSYTRTIITAAEKRV